MLKQKIIILCGITLTIVVGTFSSIVLPVVYQKNNSATFLNILERIIHAKNFQNTKRIVQEQLYGLDYKNNNGIATIKKEQLKQIYTSANSLADFIFKNKITYNIKIVVGKEKTTRLKEILFIFKDKSQVSKSVPSKVISSWWNNEIDATNDNFALLITFFKDKLIKASFEPVKIKNVPETLNDYIYRNKIYDMIKLFFAFEAAKPTGHDFPKYNMAQNDNEEAINAIKDYLLTLKTKDSSIVKKDLERNANLEINFKKGTKPSGTIVFKFKNYKATKNIVKFKYITLEYANAKIQKVSPTTATPPTINTKVNYGTTPNSSDLNVPIQSDFSFTFASATAVNDIGQSKVTYIVDVNPSIVGTTTKTITFVVGGFETKIEHAQAKIDGVTINTVDVDPYIYDDKIINQGIVPTSENLDSPFQDGFTFTFASATPVDEAKQSKVTYTVDADPKIAGTIAKKIIFTIIFSKNKRIDIFEVMDDTRKALETFNVSLEMRDVEEM